MTKSTRRRLSIVAALAALAAPAGALAADRDTAGSPSAEGAGSTGSAAEGGTGAGSTAGSTAQAPGQELQEGLQELHAAHQAEVQGGQLAQKAAASADVKSFGEKMVTDHTQADQQLTTMARTMGVNLEGKAFTRKQQELQKMMGKARNKTGAQFDRAYMELMVKDHEKDTKEVRDLSEDAREDGHAELATMLDQTAQVMDGHLALARQIEQRLKNQKSAAAGDSPGDRESSTGSGDATMP